MRVSITAAALALCLGLPFAAHAQNAPTPAASPLDGAYAPVRLKGRTLFEISGDTRLSATDRAARINRRLEDLVGRERRVEPFSARDVRSWAGQPLIELGGEPVMVVNSADAEDNFTQPRELALRWGQKMALAIANEREIRRNPFHGAGVLLRDSFRGMITSTVSWVPRLAGALVVLLVFWMLARSLSCAARWALERTPLDVNLQQAIRTLTYYGIWLIGAIAVFTTLGFQTGGVIATLGVSGFILGFAFKDILSHFLAGLMLLLGRQFRIGDQILVDGQEGTVERVELRAMHLRTYDNRLVLIPNAQVFNSAVTSNTASPYRRREFVVSIDHSADLRKALTLALEAVEATDGVQQDPAPDVLVDDLTTASVNLRVRFYMDSLRAEYLRVGSACMLAIKEAFAREGIPMPVDTKYVVFGNPEETAEAVHSAFASTEIPLPERRAA